MTDLECGRELYQRRAWASAHEALARADRSGKLAGPDLSGLPCRAYFIGRESDNLKAAAARVSRVSQPKTLRRRRGAGGILAGVSAAAGGRGRARGGWFGRVRRLLDRQPRDCVERGLLCLVVAEQQIDGGDLEAGSATAREAAPMGERFGEADLVVLARQLEGRIRLGRGNVREVWRCSTRRWWPSRRGRCRRSSPGGRLLQRHRGVPGDLRAASAPRVDRGAGAGGATHSPTWSPFTRPVPRAPGRDHAAARRLARGAGRGARARRRLPGQRPAARARPSTRRPRCTRLRGGLAEAEEAYRSARSRLRTAARPVAAAGSSQGRGGVRRRPRFAARSARGPNRTARARTLPRLRRDHARHRRRPPARTPADELSGHRSARRPRVARVSGSRRSGAVLLAGGQPPGRPRCLRRAWTAWHGTWRLPYEAARVRVLMGVSRVVSSAMKEGRRDGT